MRTFPGRSFGFTHLKPISSRIWCGSLHVSRTLLAGCNELKTVAPFLRLCDVRRWQRLLQLARWRKLSLVNPDGVSVAAAFRGRKIRMRTFRGRIFGHQCIEIRLSHESGALGTSLRVSGLASAGLHEAEDRWRPFCGPVTYVGGTLYQVPRGGEAFARESAGVTVAGSLPGTKIRMRLSGSSLWASMY